MFRIESIDTNSTHPSNFIYDFPNGFASWLMLFTNTPGIFRVNGIEQEYPAESLVLFKPYTPLYYRACEDTYCDDWMHFHIDTNDINESLFSLGVPYKTPLARSCKNIFFLLATENFFDNEYKYVTINSLINALLNKLLEAQHINDISAKNSVLVELRRDIYMYPNRHWTLNTMAQQTFLSESHLQSLYKKLFNISCISDVINARIQNSKSLLLYSEETIASISVQCGYNSPQHFFRQFNSIVGCSPNKFRSQHRLSSSG